MAMVESPAEKPSGTTKKRAVVLTPRELAKLLGIDTRRLAALRRAGSGPHYLQLSPSITRYLVEDVADWLEQTPGAQLADAVDPQ